MKRKKTFYILRYIFAVVLIIGGLGNLSSSVPFGLCVTLAGVSLFPFIWNLIRKKAAIARWVPLLCAAFVLYRCHTVYPGKCSAVQNNCHY
ncbi:MAG: hypothetical protein ACLVEO_12880 [Lachnospiraceae bacterium]